MTKFGRAIAGALIAGLLGTPRAWAQDENFVPPDAKTMNAVNESFSMGSYAQNRAMGGAAAAMVADASATLVNPAGLSQVQRYSIGLLYAKPDNGNVVGASIVDSQTSPLAMGINYRQERLDKNAANGQAVWRRQQVGIGLSEFYGGKVHAGFGWNYVREDFGLGVSPTTQEDFRNFVLGAVFPVNEFFRIATVSELLPDGDVDLAKSQTGLAVRVKDVFALALDGIWRWEDSSGENWTVAVGTEVMALGFIGLRGGWRHNLKYGNTFWSGGAGFFMPKEDPKAHIAYAFTSEPSPTGRQNRHTISMEILAF